VYKTIVIFIKFLFRNLGVNLKLSELLCIASVKAAQYEESAKKISFIEEDNEIDNDLCLPLSYDASIYRELNRNLAHFSDGDLTEHYNQTGSQEGRACSSIRSRNDFINLISKFGGDRLEIGPFCSPILAISSETYFSDYLNTDELRLEAIEQKQNPNKVPHIDFPTKETSLTALVDTKKFAIIVSCHNIEHYPDLVTHLQEVNTILMSGGYYFLIIPDKRFSADHYQESSMLPEVLTAYAEKRKLPNIENVLKSVEFITHSYPQRHWMNDHGADPYQISEKPRVLVSLTKSTQSVQRNEYNDVHCWRFTPQSFISIIGSLNKMSLIDLQAVRVYPTLFGANEFFAVLRKTI
jgi:hypothetical protein